MNPRVRVPTRAGCIADGAGIWPGFGETILAGEGHLTAVDVPLSRVTEVQVGSGWARDGLQVVVASFKAGIDQPAAKTVTFSAPDAEGHAVIYAVQMFSLDDAKRLAALPQGGS